MAVAPLPGLAEIRFRAPIETALRVAEREQGSASVSLSNVQIRTNRVKPLLRARSYHLGDTIYSLGSPQCRSLRA